METRQICTHCLISEDVPGVWFDTQGECNYCKLYRRIEQDWPMGEQGQAHLATLVKEIKRIGTGKPYDCLVGVSGGTDSTFLLLWAKQQGLRPLAVHFDNGWNSPIATANIKNAVTKLGIDLETYVVDWEEYKDILVAFLKASFPWADAPTDLAIDATLYRIAEREKVSYILNGSNFRTEGKMPREWTYLDSRILSHIQRTYGKKKLTSFPNLNAWDFLNYNIIKQIHLVRPLNFIEYHKDQARAIIEKELGWEYYGGHHYENIYTRFVYSYLLPEKFGIDKRIITLSALVRSGEISRDQAVKSLAEPPYPPDKVEEDVEYVIKKLGLAESNFSEIMSQRPQNYTDFPSYFPIIQGLAPIVRPFFRILLSWTPPMFYEMDARKHSSAS